jgi:S1-C subfamily serine protease
MIVITAGVVIISNANSDTPSKSNATIVRTNRIGNTTVINGRANIVPNLSTSPVDIQQGLSALVASVRPSVVKISFSSEMARNQNHVGMQFLDPFYSGSNWIGSGLIVHPEGYVLTSRQVVGDIQSAQVNLFRVGNRSLFARRIASDRQSDLALLKITEGNNYPFAILEDSSLVRTGDLVVALGSPFGLSETVTHGIVSAKKRNLSVGNRSFADVIQTDAAINRGNAGGPLVNIRARVIGINIAIFSTDTTFAGIGFAISSNQARTFIDQTLRTLP